MFGERPLSPLAQELLARERGRGRHEDEALKSRAMDRARAALERDRPSGIGLRLAALAQSSGKPRRWSRTLPLLAAAVATAGLAAAGAGLYVWRAPEEKPWPSTVTAPTAPTAPGVAVGGALLPPAPATEVPVERPREPRAAPATTAGSDSSRSVNVKQYATELALLEPARSSISRGDYSAALSALGQHRREFPNGQLSQEREALRVRALWGLGQKPAALAAARAFRKRYPRSALLSWLKDEGDQAP